MKKIKSYLPIIFLIFISCSSNQREKKEITFIENIKNIDTTYRAASVTIDSIFSNPLNIDSFFMYNQLPLLSGVNMHDNRFYKPIEKGYYYGAYWFSEMDSVIIESDSIERYEPNKYFFLRIYKVGKDTQEFNKQRSYLIYVFTQIENKSLGRLNYVGQDWNRIKRYFPKNSENIENIIIYEKNNKILAFKLEKNIITAVLFVHFQNKPEMKTITSFFRKRE